MKDLQLELKALAELASRLDDNIAKEITARLKDAAKFVQTNYIETSELVWE